MSFKNVGVFRRRSLNAMLLRKRLSRKPQTTTAPTPPAGRIMSSLAASGGLAGQGGIAGKSGGLAG